MGKNKPDIDIVIGKDIEIDIYYYFEKYLSIQEEIGNPLSQHQKKQQKKYLKKISDGDKGLAIKILQDAINSKRFGLYLPKKSININRENGIDLMDAIGLGSSPNYDEENEKLIKEIEILQKEKEVHLHEPQNLKKV